MGIASIIIGGIGIPFFLVALVPFLGWLNWFNGLFVGIGLVLGIIELAKNSGSKPALAGVIVCSLIILVGAARLFLGGGIL